MEQLNHLLKSLVSTSGKELHLEPNRKPYIVSSGGVMDIDTPALQGPQISTMVFPLIPDDVKGDLPNEPKVEFVVPHNLGPFGFTVRKSPAGFYVTVRPMAATAPAETASAPVVQQPEHAPGVAAQTQPAQEYVFESSSLQIEDQSLLETAAEAIPEVIFDESPSSFDKLVTSDGPEIEVVSANDPQFVTKFSDTANYEPPGRRDDFPVQNSTMPQAEKVFEPGVVGEPIANDQEADRRNYSGDRRQHNSPMQARMDALFRQMADAGASDLHLSVSMSPMIRKDGKMQKLQCSEQTLSPEIMAELLHSIMPKSNREEFERRHDTDFAYEITGLARFRCNVFMDRKGMGGVFRIIPTEILTAEQLGLSKAIMDLCSLSKGLVVVTGPTGSGKSTTLCAMVDSINKTREDHIITIEDPIEFVHDNHKCLVNQREVHNHTDSFKDALRAALREDPDILLVGEMRDLETISIAIETAETGHLVFGTLHTTTAPSTVDRIIDQFPADRQQQIRVMLSESLKGVIAQTLLPKKGGGRVAALEVLIVTPAVSNLIREGKTFQIPSAMQTGKNHGMVMLNDSLFDLVQKGIVEPRDAYIKAVDKANFETMLTRGGFKI